VKTRKGLTHRTIIGKEQTQMAETALQELSGGVHALEKVGYAEREDRRAWQIIVIPPKKVLKAARA
jgi:hypothetical protein